MKIYIRLGEKVFDGLKLNKAGILPWKTPEECDSYFEEKMSDDNEFNRMAIKNAIKLDYNEDLHIVASKMFIFRTIAQALIGISLLLMMDHSVRASFISGGLSLISMFIHFWFKIKFNHIMFSFSQIDDMVNILFYSNTNRMR
jgi:hypothetical protein